MKNINKVKKEIEAIGLRVKISAEGLVVYPSEEGDHLVHTSELKKLFAIILEYEVLVYINFEQGYIRVH